MFAEFSDFIKNDTVNPDATFDNLAAHQVNRCVEFLEHEPARLETLKTVFSIETEQDKVNTDKKYQEYLGISLRAAGNSLPLECQIKLNWTSFQKATNIIYLKEQEKKKHAVK